MFIFIFWIVFAIAVGVFADSRRGRNGFGWFLLALLISPLLGFIFVAVMQPRKLPSLSSDRMIAGMSMTPAAPGTFEKITTNPAIMIGVPLVALFGAAAIAAIIGFLS